MLICASGHLKNRSLARSKLDSVGGYGMISTQYYPMPKKVASRRHLTRQEKRDLDIEIGFLEGIVQRDPQYLDALQLLGDDYTKRGKYLSGLNIDQKLSGLRPRDPLVFYNLACSLCLTRNFKEAADAL